MLSEKVRLTLFFWVFVTKKFLSNVGVRCLLRGKNFGTHFKVNTLLVVVGRLGSNWVLLWVGGSGLLVYFCDVVPIIQTLKLYLVRDQGPWLACIPEINPVPF